jgi:hypothetical protein
MEDKKEKLSGWVFFWIVTAIAIGGTLFYLSQKAVIG